MKMIKKVFQVLFWIFLVVVAVYSTFIIIQKIMWKDKIPSFFGYKNFIVLTGSMEPTLHMGDIVIVKETTNIQDNDIIAFRERNSVITHRVFEVRKEGGKEYYITKGDANSDTDQELLDKEQIEGKYCFKIPFLGRVILFFQKPIGMMTLFILVGIFLFLSSIKPKEKQNME